MSNFYEKSIFFINYGKVTIGECSYSFILSVLGPVAKSGVRPDWAGPGCPVGGAGHGILQAKSWNKVYSMRRYPFMNNNGCQIYFILSSNLLV